MTEPHNPFTDPVADAPEPAEVPAALPVEVPAEVPADPISEAPPALDPGDLPISTGPEAAAPEPPAISEDLRAPDPADLPTTPEPEPEPEPEPAPEPQREPELEPEPDAEPAPEDVPAAAAPGRAATAVLGAVVALLVVAVAVLGWQAAGTSGVTQDDKNRKAALVAGTAAAKLVFSYDYRHLADDFAKGSAVTTGDFKAEYAKTTKEVVSDVAPRYKTVVVADVSEGGVVRSNGDLVTLLLFVNQESSSTLSKAPKITQSRVQMELRKSGGRWLVSKITAL